MVINTLKSFIHSFYISEVNEPYKLNVMLLGEVKPEVSTAL
jgi:hypothetical protein